MRTSVVAVSVMLIVCSPAVAGQRPEAGTATDPILGIWSLDLDKSTFRPGPPPQPGTIAVRRYRLRPDGFMVSLFVTIYPEGEPSFQQVTWKYDGKDYPLFAADTLTEFAVTGAMPGTMAYKAIDAHTAELTPKDSTGKVSFVGVRRRAVSTDGTTLIDIARGTNARGQAVDNVLVFTRCSDPCLELSVP